MAGTNLEQTGKNKSLKVTRIFERKLRRITSHREKNCECIKCWRGPIPVTDEEERNELATYFHSKEIKKAKRAAKRDVKNGKQKKIQAFFKKEK